MARESRDAPRVSIGMPVYNGEEHLAAAIESALAQTYRDFELILCDNASTDRTEEICRWFAGLDLRIRYHRNPENLGASGNFRRALELARGEFFKWLAHDDLLAPTYLERCVETFDESPASVVLCFPRVLRVTYEGQPWNDRDRMSWYEANPPYDRISFGRLMRVPARRIPGMEFGLARRAVLAKTQLLTPIVYSDLVLMAELRLLGEFREIPEPLFLMRSHRITDDFKDAKRRAVSDELKFYDPKTKARTRSEWGAQWILLKSRLDAVRRSDLPAHRKATYFLWVVFGHVVIRSMTPFSMARIWLRNKTLRAWEFSSVKLIRWSGSHYLFHRSWVLLAGLRHRDRALVSLAMSSTSRETEERLVAYIADRLALRRDVHARQLLIELEGRRHVAASH